MNSFKEVFIIAGPNGAGKTTFAVNLIDNGWIQHFVNADEIAKKYTHLEHHLANFKASRVFLKTIDRLEKGKESFAFETTLSGKAYLKRVKRLKAQGWKVSLYYLFVSSPAKVSYSRLCGMYLKNEGEEPLSVFKSINGGIFAKNEPLFERFLTLEALCRK